MWILYILKININLNKQFKSKILKRWLNKIVSYQDMKINPFAISKTNKQKPKHKQHLLSPQKNQCKITTVGLSFVFYIEYQG